MKFYKQTKIIATISDLRYDEEFIRDLYENGMDVVRLNTAHQVPEQTLDIIKSIRAVSEKIAILIDTKGPEVRTIIENPIDVHFGDIVKVYRDETQGFSTTYSDFVNKVPVGSFILIDDGLLELEVIEKEEDFLVCEAKNDGVIKDKKSINVPNVHLDVPSLSEKDKEYIKFAAENKVDFIAHSFVRNKEDIIAINEILEEYDFKPKIIAKIENSEGVENIDEIIEYAYGIMIARGDLGVEIPIHKLPSIQKNIINKCIRQAKPVIVATQMLHSMIDSPRPTRAEVNDIANSVYDGADALMLSGETAFGKYPVLAVKTMSKITKEVENNKVSLMNIPKFEFPNKIRNFLCKSAILASLELPVKAIVIDTETGRSARIVSAYRGKVPIYVKCRSIELVRSLALSYGVEASLVNNSDNIDNLIKTLIQSLVDESKLNLDDLIVVLAGLPGKKKGSDFIEINTVETCLS